jgi:hypothetical protein
MNGNNKDNYRSLVGTIDGDTLIKSGYGVYVNSSLLFARIVTFDPNVVRASKTENRFIVINTMLWASGSRSDYVADGQGKLGKTTICLVGL